MLPDTTRQADAGRNRPLIAAVAVTVFPLAENPLGGWGPNVMRLLTVALAIGLTLRRKAPQHPSAYGELRATGSPS